MVRKRDGAAARRIREPGIAHVDQEIHPRADCLARVFVRRDGIRERAQLIGGMIRVDANVIGLAGLENTRAEFIKPRIILRRFNLIDGSAFGVWLDAGLALRVFGRREQIHVHGHFAVGNVEIEVDQFRLSSFKGELEPLEAFHESRHSDRRRRRAHRGARRSSHKSSVRTRRVVRLCQVSFGMAEIAAGLGARTHECGENQ